MLTHQGPPIPALRVPRDGQHQVLAGPYPSKAAATAAGAPHRKRSGRKPARRAPGRGHRERRRQRRWPRRGKRRAPTRQNRNTNTARGARHEPRHRLPQRRPGARRHSPPPPARCICPSATSWAPRCPRRSRRYCRRPPWRRRTDRSISAPNLACPTRPPCRPCWPAPTRWPRRAPRRSAKRPAASSCWCWKAAARSRSAPRPSPSPPATSWPCPAASAPAPTRGANGLRFYYVDDSPLTRYMGWQVQPTERIVFTHWPAALLAQKLADTAAEGITASGVFLAHQGLKARKARHAQPVRAPESSGSRRRQHRARPRLGRHHLRHRVATTPATRCWARRCKTAPSSTHCASTGTPARCP